RSIASHASFTFFHSSLCFLSIASDPPDLHPFPTRRSSHLELVASTWKSAGAAFTLSPWLIQTDCFSGVSANNFASPCNSISALRSEGHPSELQSRFDLVCRLLLEKKQDVDPHDVMLCAVAA